MALASLLLTTLPPAVCQACKALTAPKTAYRLQPQAVPPFGQGSDAGPPLIAGWSLRIFFPLMGMALQNHPHPCLVLVIHVHTRERDKGFVSPGGLLPLREDGCSCKSFSPNGLHQKRAAHPLQGLRLMLLKTFDTNFQP